MARRGRAVLIVGGPAAGKSSLAAALARRDWDLLADDWVVLPSPDEVVGHHLSVSLDDSSAERLGVDTSGLHREVNGKWIVPPDRLGRTAGRGVTRVIAIVRDQAVKPVTPRPASVVAHEVCAQWLVDRPLQPVVLAFTAALVGRCHLVEVDRRRPDEVSAGLVSLVEEPLVGPVSRQLQQPRRTPAEEIVHSVDAATAVALSTSVSVAEAGDAVLLHRPFTTKVLVLGGSARDVCLALLGPGRRPAELVDAFVTATGDADRRQVTADVNAVLRELASRSYLVVGRGAGLA